MRVSILGYDFFAKNLAYELQKFDPTNKNIYVNKRGFVNKIKGIISIFLSKNVFIIGGEIYKSKVMDVSLFLNKEIYIEWAGSDVLKAKNFFKKGMINEEYINKPIHFSEAKWIQSELREIGIETNLCKASLCNIEKNNKDNIEFLTNNKSIIAFTYLGKNRENFYGLNNIIKLAEKFPNVKFRVCGTDGENLVHLNNIEYLGWINNVNEELDNCNIFLRLIEHDGLSNTVLEALSKGKFIIYSYPFDYCETYKNDSELFAVFQKLINLTKKGNNNKEAINFVVKNYSKEILLKNLIKELYKN